MQPPEAPRILIVEDNEATAALQKRAVERAGYRTAMAENADEALRTVRAGGIDLMLLDNRLPGEMSGLDILTSVKAAAPDLPVIMVSGSEAEGAVLQALRSGARDFVRKDINYLEYLPLAIEGVLHSASLEMQLRGERLPPQRAVLVVDSVELAAALEKRALERAGFEVLAAGDVALALRLLGENDIGLLVIDHGHGAADGIDTYAKIRAAGHDVPSILLSSAAEEKII